MEESGRPRLPWKQEFPGSNPGFPMPEYVSNSYIFKSYWRGDILCLIALWCNGSTPVFDTGSLSSNLSKATVVLA